MAYSYSDIQTFQRCPKQYEFNVVMNLERKVQDKKLTLGIMFHQLLHGYYLDQFNEAWQDLYNKCGEGWLVDDEIADSYDVLEEAITYIDAYIAYYEGEDDGWEILHSEETFSATINGEEISFTPDLVIRDSQGVWIVDHKTTAALPKDDIPVGNYQAFLYSSVMRELYPDFRGFIFNYVRKKTPRTPRLVKDGSRVADVNRIDTTYEILRDFIMETKPDLMADATHKRRLAELKDRNRFFWRKYVFVTDEIADNILDDIPVIVAQIELCRDTGRYPRNFLPYAGAQTCDNCDFRELCVAQLRGYNVEEVLPLYQERDMSHRKYDYEIQEFDDGED